MKDWAFVTQQLIMAALWLWALRVAYITGKELWEGMCKEKKRRPETRISEPSTSQPQDQRRSHYTASRS